mmetsp:Transcript_7554/g.34218  ORF Transcript_7554/g.34218 Transcript_7554/m.34218 type:complete len:220 (+) Transcript_7554:291-950(+)
MAEKPKYRRARWLLGLLSSTRLHARLEAGESATRGPRRSLDPGTSPCSPGFGRIRAPSQRVGRRMRLSSTISSTNLRRRGPSELHRSCLCSRRGSRTCVAGCTRRSSRTSQPRTITPPLTNGCSIGLSRCSQVTSRSTSCGQVPPWRRNDARWRATRWCSYCTSSGWTARGTHTSQAGKGTPKTSGSWTRVFEDSPRRSRSGSARRTGVRRSCSRLTTA